MATSLIDQFEDPREIKAMKGDLFERAKVYEENAHLKTRNSLLASQVQSQHHHIKNLEAEIVELRNQIAVLTDSSFDDVLDKDMDTEEDDE